MKVYRQLGHFNEVLQVTAHRLFNTIVSHMAGCKPQAMLHGFQRSLDLFIQHPHLVRERLVATAFNGIDGEHHHGQLLTTVVVELPCDGASLLVLNVEQLRIQVLKFCRLVRNSSSCTFRLLLSLLCGG